MISRTWHGIVPIDKKDAFQIYLNDTGVKDALSIKGNLGVYVEIIEQDKFAHFFLCTIWETIDNIIEYAGENPVVAITYPENAVYGLISDPIIIHQEVLTTDNPFKYVIMRS